MGCFQSTESIDFDTIQPAVLRARPGTAQYSGTTERGRCQVRLFYLFKSLFLFFLMIL